MAALRLSRDVFLVGYGEVGYGVVRWGRDTFGIIYFIEMFFWLGAVRLGLVGYGVVK
jgi:hypothetical protein